LAHQKTLRKGDVSVVTEESGKVHSEMPKQFSQVLDVFAPAYNDASEKNTRWYQADESAPYKGKAGVFQADYYREV